MNKQKLLAALALVALGATAAPAPAPDLPIHEVTVYSDRARVVRRGTAALAGGESRVRLPLLPATLDPESVRLEAKGAAVRGVEVRRAQTGEFPRSEAEKLIRELEQARDVEATLRDKSDALAQERELVANLRPESAPQTEAKGPVVLFEPGGWKTALAFLDSRLQAVNEALRGVEAQLRAQEKKTAQLAERAAQLAAGDTGAPGWTAEAVLEGKGPVELALTYVAANARWYPTYDVRLSPGKPEVELDFAGLVSQETGEDWTDARLSLSTAVPATTAALPKLLSWKIGESRQFIPTPQAKPQPEVPAPTLRPGPAAEGPDRDEALRARLAELTGRGHDQAENKEPAGKTGKSGGEEEQVIALGVGTQKVINVPGLARIAIGDASIADVKSLGSSQLLLVGQTEGRSTLLVWKADGTRHSYALSVRKKDPNETISELHKLLGDREGITVRMVGDRVIIDGYAYTDEDRERVEKVVQLYPKVVSFVKVARNASKNEPAKPKEVVLAEKPVLAKETVSSSLPPTPRQAIAQVAFGAPSGWAPSFASNLPAALAGGYDFVYSSARPESIRSGGEARRVVLHAARLPASSRLTIYPALRQKAYLVAEVTNSSDKPLLSGTANLFVGADLQGQAVLDTTAVGEKVALPLGVDDAVQVQRQVNFVTRETGVFTKEDVTTYEVVIELLNPRQVAVDARVVDQVPLKGDQSVEVTFDRADPVAVPSKEDGLLEWKVRLGPGTKQVIRFTYIVKRARGAQLRQW
jgi:hypothetical protein